VTQAGKGARGKDGTSCPRLSSRWPGARTALRFGSGFHFAEAELPAEIGKLTENGCKIGLCTSQMDADW